MTSNCQLHTRKATIKARMTTGCYILQADVKRFNQNAVNATCLLCAIGKPENIDHFLCRCSYPPIKDSRERFLPRLIGYFTLHWVLRDSTNIPSTMQARSKQCMIGPAITKLSAGDLGAGYVRSVCTRTAHHQNAWAGFSSRFSSTSIASAFLTICVQN